jgi:hypothetical protein
LSRGGEKREEERREKEEERRGERERGEREERRREEKLPFVMSFDTILECEWNGHISERSLTKREIERKDRRKDEKKR